MGAGFPRHCAGESAALAASPFKVIHRFVDGSAKGSWPSGQLVIDPSGAIFGTTGRGGRACPTAEFSCGGTVYQLTPPTGTAAAWTHEVIAQFRGGKDGSYPIGRVARLLDGSLAGSTKYGGDTSCKMGYERIVVGEKHSFDSHCYAYYLHHKDGTICSTNGSVANPVAKSTVEV
jgi:hypothetical protein